MPIAVATQDGDVSCCVLVVEGERPKVRIRINIGQDQGKFVDLNPARAEELAEAMLEDARHAMGFDPKAQ